MSKKNFSSANPALAFISTAQDQQVSTQKSINQADPKKQVKSNDVPMKKNPEYIETKSKRVQMLMQPSLYEAIKLEAENNGVSVNEMMHEILKRHVNQ
jgi:predicted HicB family RNase H-like nuclease